MVAMFGDWRAGRWSAWGPVRVFEAAYFASLPALPSVSGATLGAALLAGCSSASLTALSTRRARQFVARASAHARHDFSIKQTGSR